MAKPDPFLPEGLAWQGVSARLGTVRRGLVLVGGLALLLIVLVVQLVVQAPSILAIVTAALVVAAVCWGWWLTGRVVARWRYAEGADHLAVSSGGLFRRLVLVPYGRMQYVDVTAGPLDQLVGLTRLELHTASPSTTAVIPGLTAEEAARLRDRLTASAQSADAGL